MRKKELLAYLAGFFDGEGCITFWSDTRHDRIFRLKVVVTQLNPKPINMFKKYFNTGTIYQGGMKGYRTQFIWEIKGKNSIPILEELLPYLQVKRDEAELAISYFKFPWRGPGKDRTEEQKNCDLNIVNKVKDLKRREYTIN